MPSIIKNVVDNALRSPGSERISAATQHAIYEHAVKNGDYTTVVGLAHFAGLDPEVDDLIGRDPRVKVRAAWLTRPNRPVADVVAALKSEKRSSVFTAAVAQSGLPDHVYEMILERCKGLKTLGEIATSTDVPLRVRILAISSLSRSTGKLTYSLQHSLCDSMIHVEGFRVEVLRVGTRLDLLGPAFEAISLQDLEEVDTHRLLRLLILEPLDALCTRTGSRTQLNYREQAEALKLATRAVVLFNRAPELSGEAVSLRGRFFPLTQMRTPGSAGLFTALSQVVSEIGCELSINGVSLTELNERLLSGDPEVRADAVDVLLSAPATARDVHVYKSARGLLLSAATAGVLDADNRWQIVSKTSYASGCPVSKYIFNQPNLELRVAVKAAHMCFGSVAQVKEALARAADPDAARTAFIRSPDSALNVVLALLSDGSRITEETLLEMPASVFGTHTVTYNEYCGIVEQAALFVLDRLGPSVAAWELFAELASGSSASIGDLLASVQSALGETPSSGVS